MKLKVGCSLTSGGRKPLETSLAGFHTGFFPWGEGNVDACKGCMRMSMHLLDFNEIADIFKDLKHQFSCNTLGMLPIAAVEATMTS